MNVTQAIGVIADTPRVLAYVLATILGGYAHTARRASGVPPIRPVAANI